MSNNDQVQVAVFIDWDNLAISTAADMGGAVPDVKAIVQRAQQYGNVIIAKAYAEWQATSDRLAIYRSGVEPVYAPTFRFEPDTATQAGKGKSLADPCMVADCVDALHLFPQISTFVLVTGDKDMIPVVRLAQLRGRRVVVIGPDYVAGVLREMADEFIPYRSLVEVAPPKPAEPARRFGSRSSYQRQERATPVAPAPRIRGVETRPAPEPEAVPVVVEEKAPAPAEDLNAVFRVIEDILRQRLDEGRDRVRATNLKDALMQRMPGFSERKLGFTKFKDLLKAAEKGRLVDVIAAGPVHWISLPHLAEQPTSQPAEPAPVESPMAEVTAEPSPDVLAEQRNEMIRFIYELRERSRWLTYTYVLTNLISHYAKTLPQTQAENHARAMLNYLVQEGVLRIDREPQEVEVGGARHRVPMCHLNTDNATVAEVLGFQPSGEEAAAEAPGEEQSGRGDVTIVAQPEFEQEEESAGTELPSAQVEREDTAIGGNGALKHSDEVSPMESAAVIASAADRDTEVGEDADVVPSSTSKQEQAFVALRAIVDGETSEKKPMLSASTLRARLSTVLGGLNERELGFPRFRDLLAAAEEAGMIKTQTRGHITLVGPIGPKQL